MSSETPKPKTIGLLVDDEKSILSAFLRLLEDHADELHAFASGEDALEYLEDSRGEIAANRLRINFIMTDYRMNGMTGLAFLEKLRDFPELPAFGQKRVLNSSSNGSMDHAMVAKLFTEGHLTTGMDKPDDISAINPFLKPTPPHETETKAMYYMQKNFADFYSPAEWKKIVQLRTMRQLAHRLKQLEAATTNQNRIYEIRNLLNGTLSADMLYQQTGQLLMHDMSQAMERVRELEENPNFAGNHENLDIPTE